MGYFVVLMSCKVNLTFIGRSGFNHSAFYLFRATKADLSSTPHAHHAHAKALKWCGVCTVKYVTCSSLSHADINTIKEHKK